MTDIHQFPDGFDVETACEAFLAGLLDDVDYSSDRYHYEQKVTLHVALDLAHELKLHVPPELDYESIDWSDVTEVLIDDGVEFSSEAGRFAWRLTCISRCLDEGEPLAFISRLYKVPFESREEEDGWLNLARGIIGPLPTDNLNDDERQILLTFVEEQRNGESAKDARWQLYSREAMELIQVIIKQYSGEHDDVERLAINIVLYAKHLVEYAGNLSKHLKNEIESYSEKLGVSEALVSGLIEIITEQYKVLVLQQPNDLDNS